MTETQPENSAAVTPRKRKSAAPAPGGADIPGQLDAIEIRLAGLESLASEHAGRQVHHDLVLHGIEQSLTRVTQMLDRYAPLLERAATLMDPGSKLRGLTGRGRRT